MPLLLRPVVIAAVLGAVACGSPSNDRPDAGDGTHSPPDAGPGPDAGTPGVCEEAFTFAYPDGYACNRDADCRSGLCTLSADGTIAFCTTACQLGGTGECPDGFVCAPEGEVGVPNVCVPDVGAFPLPGDGSLAQGSPCNRHEDCAPDALCAFDGVATTYCAPACADDDDCGACGRCYDFGGGQNHCIPSGDGDLGASCDAPTDCASFLCAGFCTDVCGGPDGLECPNGATCEPISTHLSLCITEAQRGAKGAGESCAYSFECAAGAMCVGDVCVAPNGEGSACSSMEECAPGLRCIADRAGTYRCALPGDAGTRCSSVADCAEGLRCQKFSPDTGLCTRDCGGGCGPGVACVAPDVDTQLALFAGGVLVASNDDIDLPRGRIFSEIRDVRLEPGSYRVKVSAADHAGTQGGYTLSLHTGAGVPATVHETTAANDTEANAQALAGLPVDVKGTLSAPTDVDWYAFTVGGSEAVTLTLRTSHGEPTVCLAEAAVGQLGRGATCGYNLACASRICDRSSDVCVQTCAIDDDCGTGLACRVGAFGAMCVDAALVEVIERGYSCEFDWECADGVCLTSRGSYCTSTCGDTSPCPIGWECAPAGENDALMCVK